MPPRIQRQTLASRSASDLENLGAAVSKLFAEISRARYDNGSILAAEATKVLRGKLPSQFKKGSNFGPHVASELLSEIEDAQQKICLRMVPRLFAIVVQVLLRCSHSRNAERCLYLLASSLNYDHQSEESQHALQKRKKLIGDDCLQNVACYFADNDNPVSMRRWVGILLSQLLSGSAENCLQLELGPEKNRRGIGALIRGESEILRSLAGQLIRDLLKAEVPREDLFPLKFQLGIRDKFPGSTYNDIGWGSKFNDYIDELFEDEKNQMQATKDKIQFAFSFNLIPGQNFGSKQRHVNIILFGSEMTVHAPSVKGGMDQILDIPIHAIKRMGILFQEVSQKEGLTDVVLELENTKYVFEYLDTARTEVARIYFSIDCGFLQEMKDYFQEICPNIDLIEKSKSDSFMSPYFLDLEEESQQDWQGADIARCSNASRDSPKSVYTSTSQEVIEIDRGIPAISKLKRSPRMSDAAKQMPTKHREVTKLSPAEMSEKNNEGFLTQKIGRLKINNNTALKQANLKSDQKLKKKSAKTNRKVIKSKAKIPLVKCQKAAGHHLGPIMVSDGLRSIPGLNHCHETMNMQDMKPAEKLHTANVVSNSIGVLNPESHEPTGSKEIAHCVVVQKGNRQAERSQPENSRILFKYDNITSPNNVSPSEHSNRMSKTASAESKESKRSISRTGRHKAIQLSGSKNMTKILERSATERENVFDFPTDGEQESSSLLPIKATVADKPDNKQAESVSTVKILSAFESLNNKKGGKKKKLSTPVSLQRGGVAKRQSKRVAATEAKNKLQRADVCDDDGGTDRRVVFSPKLSIQKDVKRKTNDAIIDNIQCNNKAITSRDNHDFNQDQESTGEAICQDHDSRAKLKCISNCMSSDIEKILQDRGGCDRYSSPNPRLSQRAGTAIASAMDLPKLEGNEISKSHTDDITLRNNNSNSRKSGIDLAEKLESILSSNEELSQLQMKAAVCRGFLEENVFLQETTRSRTSIPPAGSVNLLPREMIEVKRAPTDVPQAAEVGHECQMQVRQNGRQTPIAEKSMFENEQKAFEKNERRPFCTSSHLTTKQRSSPKGNSEAQESLDADSFNKSQTANPTDVMSVVSLVDGPMARTPQIAALSVLGSVNQELSEVPVIIPDASNSPGTSSVAAAPLDPKRKRSGTDLTTFEHLENRPFKKIQSVSPKQLDGVDRSFDIEIQNINSSPCLDNHVLNCEEESKGIISRLESSLPKLSGRQLVNEPQKDEKTGGSLQHSSSTSLARLRQISMRCRIARPSSQASRVDINGSPMASPNAPTIDHIAKLEEKLNSAVTPVKTFSQLTGAEKVEMKQNSPHPTLFGAKFNLGESQPNFRPSSPDNHSPKYVVHKENYSDQYEELGTKRAISGETSLTDPFAYDIGTRSSGFIERLQDGIKAEAERKQQQITLLGSDIDCNRSLPRNCSKGYSNDRAESALPVAYSRVSLGNNETTLVDDSRDSNCRVIEQIVNEPCESDGPVRNFQWARKTTGNSWSIALRPHYQNLSDAVHRIADEVIISLAEEENKMGLVAEQYKENGSNILRGLEKKRENEQTIILGQLELKKTQMFEKYDAVKSLIAENTRDAKDNSVNLFEKEWQKSQVAIQETIDNVMELSEEGYSGLRES